jgi:branched-chain amino acid aminotransferase
MKINRNGILVEEENIQSLNQNRAFGYGDGLFDTLKFFKGEIQFLEEHYFRLMSSMRMLRMKIPATFTLEAYGEEIRKTLEANEMKDAGRVRVNFYRTDGGGYKPRSNQSEFLIEVGELPTARQGQLEVELFKDFHLSSGLLSTIKTNNRIVNVLASIFASENDLQNAILINEKKELVAAANANLFLVKDGTLLTPALQCGCINGIIRRKIIETIQGDEELQIEEASISPFELLKADEVFLSNSLIGVQSVDRYRKKSYSVEIAQRVRKMLNDIGV